MRGHKGCIVCKQDHRARDHHSPHEVKAAFEKLKNKHPSALLTVEDLAYVIDEVTEHEPQDNEENDPVFSDSDDSAYIVSDDLNLHKEAEIALSNYAFCHGRSFHTDRNIAMAVMNRELKQGERSEFKGLMLDTCANRSSVMSLNQYKAYCREFNVPVILDKSDPKSLTGIGGRSKIRWLSNYSNSIRRFGFGY